MQIYDIIQDAEVLLGLASEELAHPLLLVATRNLQNGMVHRNTIVSIAPAFGGQRPYPQQHSEEIRLALLEALHWIEVNGLLLPAADVNGSNGWRVFSRRGRSVLDRGAFDTFRRAADFPRSMLHPLIAERVWLSLARGDYDGAVFFAFRAVEEEVRKAAGFGSDRIGVKLMRDAFDPNRGALTVQGQLVAEKEALAHLFVGAIGSYKNPHSHRTVTIEDHGEAQEMVILASHLLRIVDSRRPARAAG